MKILGIGNAIVDVICKVEDDFIAKNSLTKSSAGDKHETSRALMQSEYDKLYQNYSLQLKQQKVIETLDLSKKSVIGNGSLVQTDRFFYFIGIGLGKHKIMSNNVMLISELSPIGKLLVGRNKNDVISFNNKKVSSDIIHEKISVFFCICSDVCF